MIVVHLHATVDECGVWCDDCRLPSAIRIRLSRLSADGVGDGGMMTTCPECGEVKRAC